MYFLALNLLAQSYRFKNIAIASLIMEIVNLVTYIGVSYWKFGDTLSRLEIAGLVLGVAAITCFELG
jgi:multidrug transporter EmrE-like cation transporter